MKFVLMCHPAFLGSESMPRFARMIEQALRGRGYSVECWQPVARAHAVALSVPGLGRLAKWAGYVDQYVVFPWEVRARLRREAADTLFVFCDQALGPWVPLVAHRPHVVHAHDLLALKSALGLVPQNATGWTGRLYQRYIRRGFQRARHFISVSGRTREDLRLYGGVSAPETSEVVYNGLNHPYRRVPRTEALACLTAAGLPAVPHGMLLHVGGNTWYKNTEGVVRLYAAYAASVDDPLPLWMVSPPPSVEVQAAMREVPAAGRITFMQGLDTEVVEAAYSMARLFLFPSLAEGFGWPIIEAQACGARVLTTDDAPMNEIAGPDSVMLPLRSDSQSIEDWARAGASRIQAVLAQDAGCAAHALEDQAQQRVLWASKFSQAAAIEGYLRVYERVMKNECGKGLS
jgi:glycosyltransferase involved in cell wall biosynthesis